MLDRDAIVGALERLAALLRERGAEGEVCMLVRELARTVAAERALPPDWLNDGAKAFISARHETTDADLPQFEGLRLTAPTAEYMLAMKCMASRIAAGPDDPGDVGDIAFLVSRLGLRSAAEALAIVARYYPEDRVPPRAAYLLEDMFSRRETRP